MNRATPLGLVLLALSAGCAAGQTDVANPSTNGSQPSASVEVTRQPADTTDGGFVMDVSKAVGDHTSQALAVTYEWGGKAPRQAWVSDAGGSWRIQFQDKPATTELTTVKLQYTFPITTGEQSNARKQVESVAREYVTAAVTAAGKTDTATADRDTVFRREFSNELDGVVRKVEALQDYQTKEGRSARDLVFEELGLVRTADGKVELTNEGYARLPDIARLSADQAAWTRSEAEHWTALEGANARKCGAMELKRDASQQDTLKSVSACLSALTNELRQAAAAYREKTPALTKEEASSKPFRDAYNGFLDALQRVETQAVPVESFVSGDLPTDTPASKLLADLVNSYRTLKDAADADASKPTGPDFAPRTRTSFRGIAWGVHRYGLVSRSDRALHDLSARLAQRTQTLTQQQPGSVLLERSPERRYWDFATGAVYVTELGDVVLPMLLAFCPWTCLQRGETMGDGFGKSVSVDVGTRVGVFDRDTDARHLDRPGLLVGASVNPFYFFRLSAGMYAFENSQTDVWNEAFYAGGTINVIHAAELLGPLGISPSTLKAEGKTESQ